MNRFGILVAASILQINIASVANAFDARRTGFQVGIGVGAHSSTIRNESNFAPSHEKTQEDIAVDVQLGYGFSNRIAAYIGGNSGTVLLDGREGSLVIAGFGGTMYWSDNSPSLYLTSLVGRGSLSMHDEAVNLSDTGFGWLAGFGIEVVRGLHLELSYARADVANSENELDKSALESTFVTLKYVWY